MLLFAMTGLMMASCSTDKDGNVHITLPEDFSDKTLVVSHITLENMFAAENQDELVVIHDTLDVKDRVVNLKIDPAGPAWYNIEPPVLTRTQPEFFASPGDVLTIVIKDFDPLDYKVTGTELMEDITALNAVTTPIRQEYLELMNEGDNVNPERLKANLDSYDAAIKTFVSDHPKSPVVPYAILDLSGDDFKKIYDNMTPEAKASILMPYADQYNRQVEEMLKERNAEETRKAEVASGTITAPGFTLPDLNGKKVSLSDFRGKWVVLDFWGSWCGWCVKGFPALKEAYNKYGDKITVIGIDCNESEADWRTGVKEHQLPWINVYNGHDRKLYTDYNIEGFPTKAIINPEGKLVDLTTGEDPDFFTRLDSFISK